MSNKSTSKNFEQLSWPEIKKISEEPRSTIVWPLGATEQHGYHLPLSTDSLIAEHILEEILKRLSDSFPIIGFPTQRFGFSPEHCEFEGTISLSSKLMIEIIVEVGKQINSMGFKRLVLFNAHGGQIGLVQVAARELKIHTPEMAIFPCFIWNGVPNIFENIPEDEKVNGLHAGLLETSLMLSLEPDLVKKDLINDENMTNSSSFEIPDGWSLEGDSPVAWMTNEISSTGIIGNANGSNLALGKEIEEKLISHWVELLSNLMRSNWPN